MPAPYNAGDVRVRVSPTKAGTYATIGYVRSVDFERGREGDTTIRWLGGDSVKPGGKNLSGTLPVWWDDEDTDGQAALESAYASDDVVWLEFCPRGTAAGAKCYRFEAIISSVSVSADSEGEAVEGSFSFSGSPSTYEEVTIT